ncbi:MAG: hypothetical protein M0C28_26940 [Candidatus Moduliflexus flocculans]|nr:hypothetical protein [Candidatus Moduliflexus flocculans]
MLASDVHLFATQPGIRWIGQDRRESSASNFAGESEPAGVAVSYLLKAKPKEGVKVRIYAGTLLLNEIAGKAEAGLNTVVWNMTGRRERTPEEKEAAQTMARRAREAGYGERHGRPEFRRLPGPARGIPHRARRRRQDAVHDGHGPAGPALLRGVRL